MIPKEEKTETSEKELRSYKKHLNTCAKNRRERKKRKKSNFN